MRLVHVNQNNLEIYDFGDSSGGSLGASWNSKGWGGEYGTLVSDFGGSRSNLRELQFLVESMILLIPTFGSTLYHSKCGAWFGYICLGKKHYLILENKWYCMLGWTWK